MYIIVISVVILTIVIIFFIYKKSTKMQVKSKKDKREEIVNTYKKQLTKSLLPLQNNRELFLSTKSNLLKEFSTELSRNIFFDKDDIRDVIQELVDFEV